MSFVPNSAQQVCLELLKTTASRARTRKMQTFAGRNGLKGRVIPTLIRKDTSETWQIQS